MRCWQSAIWPRPWATRRENSNSVIGSAKPAIEKERWENKSLQFENWHFPVQLMGSLGTAPHWLNILWSCLPSLFWNFTQARGGFPLEERKAESTSNGFSRALGARLGAEIGYFSGMTEDEPQQSNVTSWRRTKPIFELRSDAKALVLPTTHSAWDWSFGITSLSVNRKHGNLHSHSTSTVKSHRFQFQEFQICDNLEEGNTESLPLKVT